MQQSTEELLEELFGDPLVAAAMAKPAVVPQRRHEDVQVQLDAEVVDAFRAAGGDWQQRINRALNTWLAENDPKQMHSA